MPHEFEKKLPYEVVNAPLSQRHELSSPSAGLLLQLKPQLRSFQLQGCSSRFSTASSSSCSGGGSGTKVPLLHTPSASYVCEA